VLPTNGLFTPALFLPTCALVPDLVLMHLGLESLVALVAMIISQERWLAPIS
jgi:uncharacterized membrane protein